MHSLAQAAMLTLAVTVAKVAQAVKAEPLDRLLQLVAFK